MKPQLDIANPSSKKQTQIDIVLKYLFHSLNPYQIYLNTRNYIIVTAIGLNLI